MLINGLDDIVLEAVEKVFDTLQKKDVVCRHYWTDDGIRLYLARYNSRGFNVYLKDTMFMVHLKSNPDADIVPIIQSEILKQLSQYKPKN